MPPPKALITVHDLLRGEGFTPEATAGILANLDHESDGDPAAIGDNGASFGLAQWNKERADDLMDFADKMGIPAQDPKLQAMFLISEVEEDPTLYESLNKAGSAAAAADIFQRKYERPARYDPERSVTANAVFEWMKPPATKKTTEVPEDAGLVEKATS